MAEILGLASSIITVVGVAGKLGTSTIRLKRLWNEVQDIPASIQRCIEHLELLAPAIEDMDDEFQRTRTMVQNDSAAKRSLEYSRKAVATLECLVRDMETQLTTAKKGRKLVAQLKVRMKKEVIEEHQQQLQSVLQLVGLSQQTYLIALSRAQPEIIISEIRNWQDSNHGQLVSGNADEDDVATGHEQTTGITAQALYSSYGSRNWWASKYYIPWRNAGLFGRISYVSRESVDNISTSQLRVQPPNWLASKAWDLQVCRALTGWNIQMRTWITRPYETDIFKWVMIGSADQVVEAIMNKEASLYDRNPAGHSLAVLALFCSNLKVLGRLIDLGISLDDFDVEDAIDALFQTRINPNVKDFQELNQTWEDHKEELLKDVTDEQSGLDKVARTTNLWKFLGYFPTAQPADFIWGIDWGMVDPQVAFETISQGLVNLNELRRSTLEDYRLQDFAIQYLHEYLNCSPWMDNWRLVAQKLFQGAAWEDLVALNIDQIVKDIWQWQLPLGAFGKWLDRVLAMLKEDFIQAGIVFEGVTSPQCIVGCKKGESGLGTMWMSTDDCSALWDPYVEELAGEFWYTVENIPLAVPGSWLCDDEDDDIS
ncbi:hypothetical protein FIE12Z_7152, partial [Fusarium flagelliforme]